MICDLIRWPFHLWKCLFSPLIIILRYLFRRYFATESEKDEMVVPRRHCVMISFWSLLRLKRKRRRRRNPVKGWMEGKETKKKKKMMTKFESHVNRCCRQRQQNKIVKGYSHLSCGGSHQRLDEDDDDTFLLFFLRQRNIPLFSLMRKSNSHTDTQPPPAWKDIMIMMRKGEEDEDEDEREDIPAPLKFL